MAPSEIAELKTELRSIEQLIEDLLQWQSVLCSRLSCLEPADSQRPLASYAAVATTDVLRRQSLLLSRLDVLQQDAHCSLLWPVVTSSPAASRQWEQERPGKEMETDNQFGGAGDEQEREQ
ncbi:hypothetical protein SKAU_G00020830 [Synaphobranchus kaupii]|uniref:Uncharacterized protein n=1 Tax=Synaphobranchus kaupii TaxID=118154 RepID=A0A9Q1GBT8_SYNKA|nr:hypothetical protein SKAU_G00020830 [Synaphobranchus kaupii]